jgi:hypothetical protein
VSTLDCLTLPLSPFGTAIFQHRVSDAGACGSELLKQIYYLRSSDDPGLEVRGVEYFHLHVDIRKTLFITCGH